MIAITQASFLKDKICDLLPEYKTLSLATLEKIEEKYYKFLLFLTFNKKTEELKKELNLLSI